MTPQEVVNLENGTQAINMTPSLEGSLALVHLSVIKRLIANLPVGTLEDTKTKITDRIFSAISLDEVLTVLEEELAFQRTVNVVSMTETTVLTS